MFLHAEKINMFLVTQKIKKQQTFVYMCFNGFPLVRAGIRQKVQAIYRYVPCARFSDQAKRSLAAVH